jgi:hypothetical protein
MHAIIWMHMTLKQNYRGLAKPLSACMLEPKNICTAKNICTRFASKKKTQHQTTSHNSKNGRFCYRTAPPPSASFGNFSAKN